MYYKNELTEQRVGCWIMAAFLALLPFHFFYSQVALAAFALHTLLFLKKQNIKKAFTLPVLVVSSVYLLSLLSILYSSNKPEGLHIAGKQSALLIMPVLVAISNINFEKHRPLLFSVFAFSCTAVIISLYGYSFYAIQKLNLPASFLFSPGMMNHQFSQPAGIHPTYLSMYVVFSICFFTCLFFGTEKGWKKTLYAASSIILMAGLLQLSSKAAIISLFISMPALPFFLPFHFKKRILFISVLFLVYGCLAILVLKTNTFKERFVTGLREDLGNRVSEIDGLEPRAVRWKAILEIIKKSPVYGFGSGSETKLLQEKYLERQLTISYRNAYNTHSQYLGFLLKTGAAGLLLYLSVLLYGIRESARKKDFMFFVFIMLVAIVSVSENILDLNKGIFFYSFMFSCFLINDVFNSTQKQPHHE